MCDVAVDTGRWWSQDTVAVVTGANKGLGFEIVKQLAENGVTTVLTSRDAKRGEEAVQELLSDGLPVVYHQLDVTDVDSVLRLRYWLQGHYRGIDILINNAAILDTVDSADLQTARRVFDTNYYGVTNVTGALLPLMRASDAGARIVNVSAKLGQLERVSKEAVRHALADVDNLSEQVIEGIISDYFAELQEKQHSSWIPSYATNYSLSKVCQNAYTRLLAKTQSDRPAGHNIHVNAFCPGPTATDMRVQYWRNLEGPPRAYVSTHEAAGHAVWLCLLPASKMPSGILSTERTEIDFHRLIYT